MSPRRARARGISFIPVLGSKSASLMFLTISVMLLMVPFLDIPKAESVVGGSQSLWVELDERATDILKFPPTKNWRPMIAGWCEEFFSNC